MQMQCQQSVFYCSHFYNNNKITNLITVQVKTHTSFKKWIKNKEQNKLDKMEEQTEVNSEQTFIILVVSLMQRIKILRDGIAIDNHKIVLGHAYLPFTCICLACVCGQLFLHGSHKLIMKDKQSSVCQLPAQITSHVKSLPLSTEPQALGLVSCQETSSIELTRYISPDICLPKTVLFPTYEEEEEKAKEDGEECGWGGGWRYLFVVKTLPVFSAHSTAGVPISYCLSCAVVCVTEEAAGWGLTGCRGT